MGRRTHDRGAPGARRRELDGRPAGYPGGSHQRGWLHGEGRRRRRSGDGDRADGRGHYVKGLPRSAFHVSEDDQPQTITHFASEDVPLELIVAVDISGSMAPAMPKMKQAVKEFLGAVPARDQVTLLGFNDSVFTLTRNTTNPADRVKAVDRLARVGANRALRRHSARHRDAGPTGRTQGDRRVFSDGEDEGATCRSTTSSSGCRRATSRCT